MSAALKTLIGQPYRMEECIFHLYHDQIADANPYFHANEKLWLRYQEALGDVAAMRGIINERKEEQ
jgi:hypothetical protein